MREQEMSPDLWLEANHERIFRLLRAERDAQMYGYVYDPELDLSKKTLSEMGFCDVNKRVSKKIGLPYSYGVVRGTLTYYDEEEEKRITRHHIFIKDQKDSIIDFTAAQYVGFEARPGGRIEVLRRMAPDLVTVFPSGLVVLRGSVGDIVQKTGLRYHHQALRPEDMNFATI